MLAIANSLPKASQSGRMWLVKMNRWFSSTICLKRCQSIAILELVFSAVSADGAVDSVVGLIVFNDPLRFGHVARELLFQIIDAGKRLNVA